MKKILFLLVPLFFISDTVVAQTDDQSVYLVLLKNIDMTLERKEFKKPMKGVKIGNYLLKSNTCSRETPSVKLVLARTRQKSMIQALKEGIRDESDLQTRERYERGVQALEKMNYDENFYHFLDINNPAENIVDLRIMNDGTIAFLAPYAGAQDPNFLCLGVYQDKMKPKSILQVCFEDNKAYCHRLYEFSK